MFSLKKFKAILVCASCSLILSASVAQAQRIVTIKNDAGGVVKQYVIKANLVALRGDKIRVSGWCASACTTYLGNPNTCVTPSAIFGFHGPSGGTEAENRRAAETLARHLPRSLQAWYLKEAAQLKGQSHISVTAAQLVQIGAASWC